MVLELVYEKSYAAYKSTKIQLESGKRNVTSNVEN
jgi:hypothetical protein